MATVLINACFIDSNASRSEQMHQLELNNPQDITFLNEALIESVIL